jgi:hypothetical protein
MNITKSCLGKERFDDKDQADAHAKEHAKKAGTPIRIYRCPFCQGFHMTSRGRGR